MEFKNGIEVFCPYFEKGIILSCPGNYTCICEHGGHPASEVGGPHQCLGQCSLSILKAELPHLRYSYPTQPFVVTSDMGVGQT